MLAARSGSRRRRSIATCWRCLRPIWIIAAGREWRSTEDTAIAASILRGGNPAWSNWRRGQDYYQEGELLWLDADTLIRKLTDNKKSLDDFQKIFLGKGGNTGPLIVTYTFDELVEDLNEVMPYDWATFLHDRVDKINPRADLAGIEQGGYKLVYKDKPSASERMMADAMMGRGGRGVDCWYSIGLRVAAKATFPMCAGMGRRQGEAGAGRKDHRGERADILAGCGARRRFAGLKARRSRFT